jgi:Mg-chelatase subunit ChlD
MRTKVYNLIILDESGSMQCIKRQAINGVNETMQTIRAAQKKHEEQEHYVTLVSFNSDSVKTLYDQEPIAEVKEITDEQYRPSCCTPLYDAMGNSLTKLSGSVEKEDTVLVTIITDGEENSSEEYTQAAIKSLVDSLKDKGWVFTYIGANQDVVKVAATISVTNTLSFETTEEDTSAMFARDCAARTRFFDTLSTCGSPEERDKVLKENYFEDK